MRDLYFRIHESRLKYWIQFIFLSFIMLVMYQSIEFIYVVFCGCFFAVTLYVFLKKSQRLLTFAVLDHDVWTFDYEGQIKTQVVHAILDHQLYFIICFNKGVHWSTQIIWKDQFTYEDYKKMKILARLYRHSLVSKN